MLCFFEVQIGGFQWNGSLSVNERIVDNAAFRLLLDASQPDDSYNELPLPWLSLSYSREKIMFISAIQGLYWKSFRWISMFLISRSLRGDPTAELHGTNLRERKTSRIPDGRKRSNKFRELCDNLQLQTRCQHEHLRS